MLRHERYYSAPVAFEVARQSWRRKCATPRETKTRQFNLSQSLCHTPKQVHLIIRAAAECASSLLKSTTSNQEMKQVASRVAAKMKKEAAHLLAWLKISPSSSPSQPRPLSMSRQWWMEPNEVLAPHYRKKEGNKKLRDPAVACGRPSPSAATLTHHAVESHTRAPSTDLARKKKKKTTDAILRLIENNAGAVLRSQVPVDTPHRHKTRTHTKKRGSERMRHPPPPHEGLGKQKTIFQNGYIGWT